MYPRGYWGGLLMTLVLTLPVAPLYASELVLNEILYDPMGADGGQEFVELFWGGTTAHCLEGVRLEFANGSAAPEWQLRWTGTVRDTIQPGGFFLIVDTGWESVVPLDVEVSLALQNGPDAVRLTGPTLSQDVLGYGDLADSTLYEGEPHPDVASGYSVARRPDGFDSDNNLQDWVALADPTPGSRNFQLLAGRVSRFEACPASLPVPSSPVELRCELYNCGLVEIAAGTVSLLVTETGESIPAWLDQLPPGQGQWLQYAWTPLAVGRYRLELELTTLAGENPWRLPAGRFQVGITGPYLNEVMAAPASTSCEWVEIGNAGPVSVALDSLQIRDEDGDWRILPCFQLAPDQFVVLVQDRDRFLGWWEGLVTDGAAAPCGNEAPVTGSLLLGGWPSLNNSAPDSRQFADRLYLGDSRGVVLDQVTLGEQEALPVGRSLERIALAPRGALARNWGPATTALGGTPACGNSIATLPASSATLTLIPNPFVPGGQQDSVLHIQFQLTADSNGWDVRVFDLWGRLVRDLGGDELGTGPRDLLWDGRDDRGELVEVGAYIVLLRLFDSDHATTGGVKRLAVVHDNFR
ncbi:MAG: hypothetical protein ABIF77_06085 [bacterium]